MNATYRVLLVEDDLSIAKMVKKYLEARNYHITHCPNGKIALETFSAESFDLCISDITMPVKDGFTLATDIRKINSQIPILFMSAKNYSSDKIMAFRIGVDDYITKPFDVEELWLRVEAIMKRVSNAPMQASLHNAPPSKVQIGNYELDTRTFVLSLGDDKKKLTAKEAEVLLFMFNHKEKQINRDFILEELWGDNDYYKSRSLDVFISRLRKYLSGDPRIEIINIHGVGFKFIVQ